MIKRSIGFAALFIFLALVGCKRVELHHNLQEIEADEILVVLHQNGIEAKKVKEVAGQEVSWTVSVSEKDLPKARQILISNHLPRRRELGLSGVYKEKGLIPTPDEQKARFLLALKGEIINSLQKIPGVVDSDVVLNVPSESEFADLDPVKKRPTASVVVKTRNDERIAQTVTEAKVQRFVANSIPNMDPNDVAVIVTRIDTGAAVGSVSPMPSAPVLPSEPLEEGELLPLPSGGGEIVELAGLKMAPDSVGRFKGYIIGLLTLLVGVSFFLLFNIVRLNRLRLKVQRAVRPDRMALGGGDTAGLLGEGQGGQGVEGTFDVGARQRQV
jgi:type III secretion protein J